MCGQNLHTNYLYISVCIFWLLIELWLRRYSVVLHYFMCVMQCFCEKSSSFVGDRMSTLTDITSHLFWGRWRQRAYPPKLNCKRGISFRMSCQSELGHCNCDVAASFENSSQWQVVRILLWCFEHWNAGKHDKEDTSHCGCFQLCSWFRFCADMFIISSVHSELNYICWVPWHFFQQDFISK